MVMCRTFVNRVKERAIQSNCHVSRGTMPLRLPPSLAQHVHVVASFGLVSPSLDLRVGDGIAANGRHSQSIFLVGAERYTVAQDVPPANIPVVHSVKQATCPTGAPLSTAISEEHQQSSFELDERGPVDTTEHRSRIASSDRRELVDH